MERSVHAYHKIEQTPVFNITPTDTSNLMYNMYNIQHGIMLDQSFTRNWFSMCTQQNYVYWHSDQTDGELAQI